MPTIRLDDSDEGEGVAGGAPKPVSGEIARVTNNITLSEHVGKFIAGEIATKFKTENLADSLKGKNAIHVSFSWG